MLPVRNLGDAGPVFIGFFMRRVSHMDPTRRVRLHVRRSGKHGLASSPLVADRSSHIYDERRRRNALVPSTKRCSHPLCNSSYMYRHTFIDCTPMTKGAMPMTASNVAGSGVCPKQSRSRSDLCVHSTLDLLSHTVSLTLLLRCTDLHGIHEPGPVVSLLL